MGKNNKRILSTVEFLKNRVPHIIGVISVLVFAGFLRYIAAVQTLEFAVSISFSLLIALIGSYIGMSTKGGMFNDELFTGKYKDITVKTEGDLSIIGVFVPPIIFVLVLGLIVVTYILYVDWFHPLSLMVLFWCVVLGGMLLFLSLGNIRKAYEYSKIVESDQDGE